MGFKSLESVNVVSLSEKVKKRSEKVWLWYGGLLATLSKNKQYVEEEGRATACSHPLIYCCVSVPPRASKSMFILAPASSPPPSTPAVLLLPFIFHAIYGSLSGGIIWPCRSICFPPLTLCEDVKFIRGSKLEKYRRIYRTIYADGGPRGGGGELGFGDSKSLFDSVTHPVE